MAILWNATITLLIQIVKFEPTQKITKRRVFFDMEDANFMAQSGTETQHKSNT